MNKSRAPNKYLKWLSRENFLEFKKVKNKCNSLTKKAKKDRFRKNSEIGITTNKFFQNTVKPFMTNMGAVSNDSIVIEYESLEISK